MRFGHAPVIGRQHGGRGSASFGMGRKLGSADLQLIILGLLADKPSHGYEIIKALDARSKGFYVPSAGMIYPALCALEGAGRAVSESQGNRKLYRLTDAGLEYLATQRATLDAMLAQFDRIGSKMARVRRAFDDDDADSGAAAELQVARGLLAAALEGAGRKSNEEQLRIAALLARAAHEINAR